MMLKGTELQGKIGEYGTYTVDVDDKLNINANITMKIDLVQKLDTATAGTQSTILQKAVAMVKKFTGKDSLGGMIMGEDEGQDPRVTNDQGEPMQSQAQSQNSSSSGGATQVAGTDMKESNTETVKQGETL